MIEKESFGESNTPVDFMGAFKLAGVVIVGILALIGFGWEDLLGEDKGGNKRKAESTPKSEVKKESDIYLDEEIDEESLDEHTTGLT